MYDGIDVYNTFVMLLSAVFSGESEYVVYKTRSVHDGTLFVLRPGLSDISSEGLKKGLPIGINLVQFILVAALELPEVSLAQTYKYGSFPFFHGQLVKLLELFA